MYYIFSFRSRAESMAFFDDAKKAGLCARLITTPRVISIGCGLSVKIVCESVAAAEEILERCQYTTFLGLFYYNGSTLVRVKK